MARNSPPLMYLYRRPHSPWWACPKVDPQSLFWHPFEQYGASLHPLQMKTQDFPQFGAKHRALRASAARGSSLTQKAPTSPLQSNSASNLAFSTASMCLCDQSSKCLLTSQGPRLYLLPLLSLLTPPQLQPLPSHPPHTYLWQATPPRQPLCPRCAGADGATLCSHQPPHWWWPCQAAQAQHVSQ